MATKTGAATIRARLRRLLATPPMPQLAGLAAAHPAPVALVGGALRDALLERAFTDLDLVVAWDLEKFIDALEQRLGRRPTAIGDRFQDTHRVRWKGMQIDIAAMEVSDATMRGLRRGYLDGGISGLINEDLRRRDFTINAMALRLPVGPRPETDLADPFGGVADLAAGLIRCTSPEVLKADPLRCLRAVRYASTLEGFHTDLETLAAIGAAAGELSRTAPERVQSEWVGILGSKNWARGVALAYDLGLGDATLGAIGRFVAVPAWSAAEASGVEIAESVAEEVTPGGASVPFAIRLAALVRDLAGDRDPGEIEERLRASRWPPRVVAGAARVARQAVSLVDVSDEVLAQWALEDPGAASRSARLAAAIWRHRGAAPPGAAGRLAEFALTAAEPAWITGSDLREWEMPEGPQLGQILTRAAIGRILGRWPGPDEMRRWAHAQVEAYRVREQYRRPE